MMILRFIEGIPRKTTMSSLEDPCNYFRSAPRSPLRGALSASVSSKYFESLGEQSVVVAASWWDGFFVYSSKQEKAYSAVADYLLWV